MYQKIVSDITQTEPEHSDKQEDSHFLRRYAVFTIIIALLIIAITLFFVFYLKGGGNVIDNDILLIQVIVIGSLMFIIFTSFVIGFYFSLRKTLTSLENAKLEAELSSKAKSNFLANMSHEVRTPMNAILGITEIELQKETLNPDTEKSLEKIHESGDLLMNIINDILDLSKIDAGKLEIRVVKYDIPGLIGDAVQLNRLRYENKPIKFELEIDENVPLKLYGDVLRIKQILNNILSNAFKYTDEGTVKLTIGMEKLPVPPRGLGGIILVFSVSDTGKGMSPEELDMLFTEYTRFVDGASSTTVGTGLGMTITKRLLTLMGGEIIVDSEPNVGSTFTVKLVQERVDKAVCGPALAKEMNMLQFQSKSKSKRSRFLREHMPYGSVLVVDDVESNVYVTKGILETYSLQIETASSGFEALEKVKKGIVYDIIFMDHMMPKMDGMETTKKIRDMGYTGCIIALTANALVGQAEIFMENGFDGFLSKPMDLRELNQILNDFIRDKKPAEVVKAARKVRSKRIKVARQTATGRHRPELRDLFIQDATSAIPVLERVCAKEFDLNKEEVTSYEIAVHGMKSALKHIGEEELAATALELERACKNRSYALMIDQTPEFIEKLQNLIETLALGGISGESDKDTECDGGSGGEAAAEEE